MWFRKINKHRDIFWNTSYRFLFVLGELLRPACRSAEGKIWCFSSKGNECKQICSIKYYWYEWDSSRVSVYRSHLSAFSSCVSASLTASLFHSFGDPSQTPGAPQFSLLIAHGARLRHALNISSPFHLLDRLFADGNYRPRRRANGKVSSEEKGNGVRPGLWGDTPGSGCNLAFTCLFFFFSGWLLKGGKCIFFLEIFFPSQRAIKMLSAIRANSSPVSRSQTGVM